MPLALTLAGPDLSTDKSAEAMTLVVADAALFAEFGSAVVVAIVTVFEIVVACAGAVTTMVMVVLAPVAQVARVHDTETLPVLLQVQPPLLGLTETNVTPAGNVSVTVTLAASEGPLLATTSV